MKHKSLNGKLALALLVCLSGCDWPGKPRKEDKPIPAERVMDFGQLYATHCAGCHGADGKDGPAPPHNDPIFLAIVPDEVLHRVVAEGRRGTPMPAFAKKKGGPLNEKQIEVLVEGMKTRWMPAERPKEPLPDYWPDHAAAGDKLAGAKVFSRACADCHGMEGEGGEKGGAVNDKAFLSLISDQTLRRIIITGRPDLGMPSYAEREKPPLTSKEINDLVAFLAYWRTGGSDQ
jgi:cytochrome c oxidase cbb3-type subunit 3